MARVGGRKVGRCDCGDSSGPVARFGSRSCGGSESGGSGSRKVGRVSRGPEGRNGGREISRAETRKKGSWHRGRNEGRWI